MTDLPWWVLAGPYAGLAGSILLTAGWFFFWRDSLAERGWKHTSRVLVFPAIWTLVGSVNMLLGGSPALQTGVAALIWILLTTMVAGMMLDAVRNMRQRNMRQSS